MGNLRNDFVVTLDTDRTINDECFARKFLHAWLNHPLHDLRPERWGQGEPLRRLISATEFAELVTEWCRVPLLFKRTTRPRLTVSLAWRRNRGLDPRPFPWGLTGWLENSGTEIPLAFLDLVIAHFNPAFASLTTDADSRHKHFVKRPHRVGDRVIGTAEEFVGHHVTNKLPGIYWITYFGRAAIERIGERRLHSLPTGRLEARGEGLILFAYDDAATIGSPAARSIEQAILDGLGRDKFFIGVEAQV